MKLLRLLLLLLLPFSTLHAQDTAVVKHQANLIAQATFKGDYETVIAYTHFRLVAMSGGKEKLRQLITERMKELKDQGITGFSGTIGTPGKFYLAGNELHCLLPEDIILTTSVGRYLSRSYLLGVSSDKGKNWTFLDVGSMSADILHQLLPNFNDDLKIPPPVKPEFLPN
ncbi:hypothetical protein [Mucilaginibacter psychrotolerans]|uniref:DUF4252 domain-containing protein n=1 Tax=Mucilaginibacter psychrotolerans TaxID=1524096 RepID=A0A4Y8RYT9_9SPHI|nr:hypothetical protein [Mucilaginibacter psychrotolerans]TFF30429.1 hypothetical protein E2R66_27270 [Mucilaginibacter psychrotolerans]